MSTGLVRPLTVDQAYAIKFEERGQSVTQLAVKYKVHPATIYRIKKGLIWKGLKKLPTVRLPKGVNQ